MKSKHIDTNATALIAFKPKPRLIFEAEIPPHHLIDMDETVTLEINECDTPVECLIAQATPFSNRPQVIYLMPLLDDVPCMSKDVAVEKAGFTLPNFPQFYVRDGQADGRIEGRGVNALVLESHGWRTVIYNTSDIGERSKHLRCGGYGITATGEIARTDGQPFTRGELNVWVDALIVFLSFACGRWTGPLLSTGLDGNYPVWQSWRVPRIDSGISVFGWFDIHHGESLNHVLPGFLERWNDPTWKQTLSQAIYWYIGANSMAAGADGSLILSQAALENLSWTYLVEDTKTLSRSRYKKLSADKSIRLLLLELDISTNVPESLVDLTKVVSDRGWKDGISAITATRNSLVHPEKADDEGPVADCWLLSQYFVELALLRLFRYEGQYGNRTKRRWVGQVEFVPWANSQNDYSR
ncbi:MAG TPA: hypothetical protein VEX68_05015 [Bryobacteraceae bacterium]|nr:hypothetical protein [Bryobacteraceae bacterium]